jgi:hypothetical protein
MHGLSIRQQNHTQILPAHRGNCGPTPDPSILLDKLANGMIDGLLNPFLSGERAIGTLSRLMIIPRDSASK